MRRLMIVGIPGAGKSTLARQLGELLGLPVYHLDRFFWQPGWVETEPAAWEAIQRDLVRQECWIIDGNYANTFGIRLPAADTVIYLDIPRRLALRRVVMRSLRSYGRVRPDMGPGCPERLDPAFLRWIWDYPRRTHPRTLAALAECRAQGKRVIHLRSPREVRQFVAQLRQAPNALLLAR